MSGEETFYKAGAKAGYAIGVLTVLSIAAFIAWPPPYNGTTLDWFKVFHDSWIVGLLSMDLLLILVLLLEVPLLLALYFALRSTNHTVMAVATVLAFIGIALHVTSIPGVEVMALSSDYFEGHSQVEQERALAAGDAMLARYQGTAFQVNYVVGGTLVPLMISSVMLRDLAFGRGPGYIGMGAGIFNLGLYVPGIGLYLSILSGLAILAWYLLVARKLDHLGVGMT